MSLKIYTINNCSTCKNVMNFFNENNISFKQFPVEEGNFELPFSIYIYPALVNDTKLLAYGDDIILWARTNVIKNDN